MTTVPSPISDLIDTERYPLEQPLGQSYASLIDNARQALVAYSTFSLGGFMRPRAVERAVEEVASLNVAHAFHHNQSHNVYFTPDDPFADSIDAPKLRQRSSNHTVCSDQMEGFVIRRIYEWEPLRVFLADVLERPTLCRMADPLARLNVMRYGRGDELGWHFDRAQFSVTVLLQAAERGGIFEYRKDLRSDDDPNYQGVANLLRGLDLEKQTIALEAGTLNVFQGYRSIHRVTSVEGDRERIIAVLSFVERDDVMFSLADRKQFYGRTTALVGK